MCGRCLELSRRSLLIGGAAATASIHAGVAEARIKPQDMVPLVGPGFKPTERDEMGLWKEMERAEEEIAGSNLLINDPKLTGYLKEIIGTVGGTCGAGFPHLPGADPRLQCDDVPERFCGGLFRPAAPHAERGAAGRRNRARIGPLPAPSHDSFLARPERKTDIFAVGAMLAGVGGAGAGVYLGNYVQLAQLGTLLSLFQYSRVMEAEADAMGAKLIAQTGYPPIEMANIWEQLIGEEDATARYRGKHRRARLTVRYAPVRGLAHGRSTRGRRRADGSRKAV